MSTHEESVVGARQRPLRETYREKPGNALTRKRVRARPDLTGTDPLHGTVQPIGYPDIEWAFGIDAKVGGFDDLPNPGHLLCAALAACLDSTIRMLADLLAVELRHLDVEVVGHVDVRGCLGLSKDVRPGFVRMRCAVQLELAPDTDPTRARLLTRQAERLCVTLDTLRKGVEVEMAIEQRVCSGA